jgi:HD superfamily phosphohydrolase
MRKVFRDPIHNLISFDKNEEKLIIDLINTKEMQRLRRIKQLGLSFVTYCGTDHSRFSHSLGVAYLAKRVINALSHFEDDLDSKKYVKELTNQKNQLHLLAAALLHDIGHGPFSHALERFTGKDHVKWTIEILSDKSTDVNKVLRAYGNDFVKRLQNIIKRTDKSILVKVISSQLDVDRFDFLLRDSLMAGVEYGRYDLEWILHSLRIREVNGNPEILLDISKGKYAAEGYILARYWMYTQVYYHKTTRGAEVLLDKILTRASDIIINGDNIPCHPIVANLLKNNSISVSDYLVLDDINFIYLFKEWKCSTDKILSDLCKRFLNRNLFKSIDMSNRNTSLDNANKISSLTVKAKQRGFDKKYYIESDRAENSAYKDYYLQSTITKKRKTNTKEEEATEQIFVLLKNGKIDEFSNHSDIINTLRNKKFVLERLYFPEELRDEVKSLQLE